jgi:hypothetical protein
VCVCTRMCVHKHARMCVTCMHMHVLALFALSYSILHRINSWNILWRSHSDARNFSVLHCIQNDLGTMLQPHELQRNRTLRVMWLRHVNAYLQLVSSLRMHGPVPPHPHVLSCYGAQWSTGVTWLQSRDNSCCQCMMDGIICQMAIMEHSVASVCAVLCSVF